EVGVDEIMRKPRPDIAGIQIDTGIRRQYPIEDRHQPLGFDRRGTVAAALWCLQGRPRAQGIQRRLALNAAVPTLAAGQSVLDEMIELAEHQPRIAADVVVSHGGAGEMLGVLIDMYQTGVEQ